MIQSILQAVFPELCLQCGEKIPRNDFFCASCAATGILKRPVPAIDEDGILRKFSFLYEGPAITLFSAAKFSDRRRALRYFIDEAKGDLRGLSNEKTLFLALPSRKKFLRRLLHGCLPGINIIFDAFRLKTNRRKADANKLLGEAKRYQRIHESLLWNSPVLPAAEKYIICDDVSTTGATLAHAAHLVQQKLKVDKSRITLWALMYRERHFRMPRQ